MKIRRKRHRGAEVSTHSLNDIMFFLLLFFIILSTMAVKYSRIIIHVPTADVPKILESKEMRKHLLSVDVDANKDFYINEQPVKFEDLERRFLDAQKKDPQLIIEMSIDKELTVQDLIDVMQMGARLDIKMYLNALKN
jgi:biopolymer transport protein ExbD